MQLIVDHMVVYGINIVSSNYADGQFSFTTDADITDDDITLMQINGGFIAQISEPKNLLTEGLSCQHCRFASDKCLP